VDLADIVEHVASQVPSGTEVGNTGPVVPRYDIPSLSEPFRRLGAERLFVTSPGVGLGLSIVRAVARAHGGDVHAEPRDGGGLVVTVSFPVGTRPQQRQDAVANRGRRASRIRPDRMASVGNEQHARNR
jgi:K+-sensing histidine kinase KdpD